MLTAEPIELKAANEIVMSWHRHHMPVVRDKFRVACKDGEKICGVIQVGRPINRVMQDGKTLEVLRCCTDGTKNACSFLYSRAARIAKEMGYKKINEFEVRYSDAYEVYGLTRTGCCGCSISSKAIADLELIRPYEPNVVKAAWNIFGPSYEYRKKYNEFKAKKFAEAEQCEGQMSIFDMLGEFVNMPEEKMVEKVGQELGVKFKQEILPKGTYRFHPEYEYKYKGLRLSIAYMTDSEGKTFISAGYRKGTYGGGGPYYSIDSAVRYLKQILKREG